MPTTPEDRLSQTHSSANNQRTEAGDGVPAIDNGCPQPPQPCTSRVVKSKAPAQEALEHQKQDRATTIKLSQGARNATTAMPIWSAAGLGDLDTVRRLIESGAADGNARKRKGGNAPIHAALAQNKFMVAKYLIEEANVDVNARNNRGQTPLITAIMCCNSMTPLRMLLRAGADPTAMTNTRETVLDIAIRKKWTQAEALIREHLQLVREKYVSTGDPTDNSSTSSNDGRGSSHGRRVPGDDETEAREMPLSPGKEYFVDKENVLRAKRAVPKGKKLCPHCDFPIRINTRMTYMIHCKAVNAGMLQEPTELQTPGSIAEGGQPDIKKAQGQDESLYPVQPDVAHNSDRDSEFLSNQYIQQFVRSPVFDILRKNPRYHHLADKRGIRKEITETYGVLEGVSAVCRQLGRLEEEVFVLDLCSGKSLTSAVFGLSHPTSKVLAVDRMNPRLVPHFENNVRYEKHDIMASSFLPLLRDSLLPSQESGVPVILVGMHLCGDLSLAAINMFANIPNVQGIVLSPCCYPSSKSPTSVIRDANLGDEAKNYALWTSFLRERIAAVDTAREANAYTDKNICSLKNNIIWGCKM